MNKDFEDNFLSIIKDKIGATNFLHNTANKEEFEGNTEHSTATYTLVREDLSTGLQITLRSKLCKKFINIFSVPFRYRSFIAANFITNIVIKIVIILVTALKEISKTKVGNKITYHGSFK